MEAISDDYSEGKLGRPPWIGSENLFKNFFDIGRLLI
jgi:hypothetical protein